MNEAETRAELIDPALKAAGWGVVEDSRTRREVFTNGRLLGRGQRTKQLYADYVLTWKGQKLAVIEAKARDLEDTEGVAQAKQYAKRLQTRFAYSTNGRRIYQIDMLTGKEGYIEDWPGPHEMWQTCFPAEKDKPQQADWRERFAAIPLQLKADWQARYYQHNAITNALEAVAAGRSRILLTLATGTGKTFIAFQIAWKLFHSRWNLSRKPHRRPRILFLADRNILANQAFNSFSDFPEDALCRISPDEIRKKGRVPKNASVFFTIFQTFLSGKDEQGQPAPYFGEYAPDFFDFIIIDECHRGGANDESSWRGIMDYFSPAVQLGLTATPKRDDNGDTYDYFGEPVYVYSLKEGVNDGFLSPFRVKQIATSMDDYFYVPGDKVMQGELDKSRVYSAADHNRIIEVEGRERYRIKLFLEMIEPHEKTLIFCKDQPHALLIRNLVNQLKTVGEADYCVRVTANDGALGEQFLRKFQDNEKTIPAILTTSQKLSTGVDARNVRNIVLLRTVGSMTEFKQIIGRGTRLFDGKDYFTIFDFEKNYFHFEDPEWDGEPLPPEEPTPRPEGPTGSPEPAPPITGEEGEDERRERIKIVLADNRERTITHMMATTFWSPEGKPISASDFLQKLYGDLPAFFHSEEELTKLWSQPDTRKALLEGLAEKGYGEEELAKVAGMIEAEKSDIFDVLSYIAFARPQMSRSERVKAAREKIMDGHDEKLQAFLDFVLQQYAKEGVGELDQEKFSDHLKVKYHNLADAQAELGSMAMLRNSFLKLQSALFGVEG